MFKIELLASMGSESEKDEEEDISTIGLTSLDDSFPTQVIRINDKHVANKCEKLKQTKERV